MHVFRWFYAKTPFGRLFNLATLPLGPTEVLFGAKAGGTWGPGGTWGDWTWTNLTGKTFALDTLTVGCNVHVIELVSNYVPFFICCCFLDVFVHVNMLLLINRKSINQSISLTDYIFKILIQLYVSKEWEGDDCIP